MSSAAAESRTLDAPIQPGIHEFGAQLCFGDDEDGLSPFFAIATQFDEALENETTFDAAGDTWQLNYDEKKVKAWEGKIAAREQDSFDAFREYNFGLVAVDDVGRKRLNLQFRPSLPDARHVDTGERIKSMPADLPEGVRVSVDAANVEPTDVIDVLQAFVGLIDVNPDYFTRAKVHHARVTNLAVYVRLRREISEERIVDEEGLLERLAIFCPRRPGQGEYVWDNEEILGHRNAVSLNPTALKKLYPGHAIGKLLKSYHMKHARKTVHPDAEPDDPTYHPKLEVQYSQSYSPSEWQSVPWSPAGDDVGLFEFDQLRDRLERHLLHALEWAEISLDAEANAYVEDAYWTPEPRTSSMEIHPDPTEVLYEEERDLATHHLMNADLTEAQREVTKVLTNGGGAYVDDVADEADVSRATVYRVADRLEGLVETVDGLVQFEDAVIREKVQDLLSVLDRQFDRLESRLRALANRSRERITEDSALGRWARRYGARFDEDGGLEVIIQLGELEDYEVVKIVREAVRAAGQVGTNTQRELLDGAVTWTTDDGDRRSARFGRYGAGGMYGFLGYKFQV